MSNDLYSGTSEGFSYLVKGYNDYAKSVISSRAVPDARDGQKPVSRRILYALYKDKVENKIKVLQKCSRLVGLALALHPHGDGSVYQALTLMTDENGTCNIPFFKGMGNLGHVYSSAEPAAMRYPKALLNDNAMDFFREADVMNLIPAEEGDGFEPTVLNAPYPVVLVNGTTGIAVSTSTKMPSFNFGDVIDLTIKRVREGKLEVTDMIYPDFPTGGVLVCNDAEVAKIMTTGRGKLKVRAKVEIEGKEILVREVPFGKTKEGIIKAINKADIKEISSAFEASGKRGEPLAVITCKSKNVVESVLMSLYQRNILQSTFASNMLVVVDGEPRIVGVHQIIDIWYKWRCEVLTAKFDKWIEGVQAEKKRLSYFIRLISNEEWKDHYTQLATKVGKKEAIAYLSEIFEDIPKDVCTWIGERAITAFLNGDSYKTRYDNLCASEKEWENTKNHLDEYIIKELTELKQSKYGQYDRKTEITYKDYKFSKITDSNEIEDTSYCVYTLYKDGFLTKTRDKVFSESVLCSIEAEANSVLIGFDNFGRVLRVLGKEIPFTPANSNGEYMPKYFDASFEEEYKVLYLSLLDGSKKTLVYRDGYIGYFDTSEYLGKKNIKIISKGVCLAVRDKLLHIYEENETPEFLVLADVSESTTKLGIVPMDNVPERSRLSRAKVLSGSNINTEYLKGFYNIELAKYISNPSNYMGKLKTFKDTVYDESVELYGGKYLDLCVDLV